MICSTPLGVIVGFGPRRDHARWHRATAQRLAGVFVGFGVQAAKARRLVRLGCSTPRGVFVGFGVQPGKAVYSIVFHCSTPRGVIVGFEQDRALWRMPMLAAQRLAASSSGSDGGAPMPAREQLLLNASRRLRRVRRQPRGDLGQFAACSTPRGVFVGFGWQAAGAGVSWITAQRLAASSSGSASGRPRRSSLKSLLNASRRLRRVRPSPRSSAPTRCSLLNASRRLRRVRLGIPPLFRTIAICSTPRGVFVGFGRLPEIQAAQRRCCSTPRGVFVGFGRATRAGRLRQRTAQRLAASSSGSAGRRESRGPHGIPLPQRLAASSSGSDDVPEVVSLA